MKKINFILFFGLILTSLLSCESKKLKTEEFNIIKQDGTSVSVTAELAIEPDERNYGFMNRKNIPDGTGMLFVFEYDQILSFWMKNTPHPLSIAYIDSKGIIRDIFDMTPFSLSSIQSTVSVRYALEVPQGWFAENNIKEGDKITLLKK